MGDAIGELADGVQFLALQQLTFQLLSVGNIASYLRGSDNLPARVADRRDSQRDMDELTIFFLSHGLDVVDELAVPDTGQDVVFFTRSIRRQQSLDRLP